MRHQITRPSGESKLPQSVRADISEICDLHAEIISAAKTSLQKAIRIGELLTAIKADLGHGAWLPWLKANVLFAERTARNYMRVFDRREEVKSATVADLASAYRLLSPPPSESDSEPRPPFPPMLPQAGQVVIGQVSSPQGGSYLVIVRPLVQPGFFYVGVHWLDDHWLDDDHEGGAYVDETRRGIRADGVGLVVRHLINNDEVVKRIEWRCGEAIA